MARTRMVTRTINVTICKVMVVKVTDSQVITDDLELTGETYTRDKALKALKKQYETDDYKIVAIQSMETREDLYGMAEAEFLKVASKLDGNRKVIED